jgi:ABC-type bacteriocin/lantibiotic exporter with double-glycine peptidase domain
VKDVAAAITKNKNKVIGWSILSTVVSLILVLVVLPVILSTDPMTVLVSIASLVAVGLVAVWVDRRFTKQNGNVPRGYV